MFNGNGVEVRAVPKAGWAGEVSPVTSWLYLSGARAVRPKRLKELNMTCVINATVELPEVSLNGIEVICVRITDSQSCTLRQYLHSVADKLLKVKLEGGKVLVHCIAGVSRSPTLILAYLVKHEGMSLKEAFRFLKCIRPVVRPNLNFFRQLLDFEDEVRGSRTISLVQIPDSNMYIPDVCEEEMKLLSCSSRSWKRSIEARRNFQNQFA